MMADPVYLPAPATPPARAWPLVSAAVLLGTVAGAVVFAPAAWLAGVVAQATQQRVLLLQPQGTLWRGSAVLALSAGPGGRAQLALPSRIGWQWSTQGLGLQLAVQAACCMPAPVQLRLDGQGLHLQPGQMQWPLALLQGLGSPWNTLQLRGDMQLQWRDVHMPWRAVAGTAAWQGHWQVHARNVATRLSTLPNVGSYVLQIDGGAAPQLALHTERGALQLQGQGQWRAQGLRFRGEAQAEPAHAAELANLLTLIGQRQGQKFVIRWG